MRLFLVLASLVSFASLAQAESQITRASYTATVKSTKNTDPWQKPCDLELEVSFSESLPTRIESVRPTGACAGTEFGSFACDGLTSSCDGQVAGRATARFSFLNSNTWLVLQLARPGAMALETIQFELTAR